MLTTIAGILVTLFTFVVTAVVVAVGFILALIPQFWTLIVQTFNAVQTLFV